MTNVALLRGVISSAMRVTDGTDTKAPLPPMELRLMQDADEQFVASGVQLAELLFRLGLRPEHALLDVGCSVGRLPIGLLNGTDFRGTYVGFDVMKKQVGWASRNLTPAAPRYQFRYVDVRNNRYNPRGTVEPQDFRFPVSADRFHMACLFSIFTHFYRDDIKLYLSELYRTLRPGGTVVATWFLYDDDRLDAAVGSEAYPMVHRLDEYTIYNNAEDPLRAIAFYEAHMRELIATAGLEVVDIEYGRWAGGPGPEFQDVVILRKPEPPFLRHLLIRARRRLRPIRRLVRR